MVDNLKKSIANMIKNNRVKESNKIRVMRQLKALDSADDDGEM